MHAHTAELWLVHCARSAALIPKWLGLDPSGLAWPALGVHAVEAEEWGRRGIREREYVKEA